MRHLHYILYGAFSALHIHTLLLFFFPTDPWHAEGWSKALLWPDSTRGPLSCHPVSTNTSEHWNESYCSKIPSDLSIVLLTSISYACLVVLLCVFRVCEVHGEAVVMAVCLVLGWCNVMFFARGFEMLGPYVIMIQKVGDSSVTLMNVIGAHE